MSGGCFGTAGGSSNSYITARFKLPFSRLTLPVLKGSAVLDIPVVSTITAFFNISFSLSTRAEASKRCQQTSYDCGSRTTKLLVFFQHSLLTGTKCYSYGPGVMESQVHQSKLIIIRNMPRTTPYEARATRITLHLANVIIMSRRIQQKRNMHSPIQRQSQFHLLRLSSFNQLATRDIHSQYRRRNHGEESGYHSRRPLTGSCLLPALGIVIMVYIPYILLLRCSFPRNQRPGLANLRRYQGARAWEVIRHQAYGAGQWINILKEGILVVSHRYEEHISGGRPMG